MNKRLQVLMVVAAAAALVAGMGPTRTARGDQPAKGLTPLFNGKDLTGWHGQKTMDPRVLQPLAPTKKRRPSRKVPKTLRSIGVLRMARSSTTARARI